MRSLIAALALLPTPSFAAFDCILVEECIDAVCEPFVGGPLQIEEQSDGWVIIMEDSQYVGYSAWDLDTDTFAAGVVTILIPRQDDMTGLISIYPTGELTFTVHANIFKPGAVAFSGNCASEGG